MQKLSEDAAHIDALHIAFYTANLNGAYDPVPLENLEMFHDSCVPMAGDIVYDTQSAEGPISYRVLSRHFDLKGQRVAVMVDKIHTAGNSPFTTDEP